MPRINGQEAGPLPSEWSHAEESTLAQRAANIHAGDRGKERPGVPERPNVIVEPFDPHNQIAMGERPRQQVGNNMTVCDGHGGFRVRFQHFDRPKQEECLKPCIVEHEQTHMKQFRRNDPDTCKDKPDNFPPPITSPEFFRDGELEAYRVEVKCVEAGLNANDACHPYLEDRRRTLRSHLDCVENHNPQEVFDGACDSQ